MANIDQHEAELDEDPLDLENVSWTSSGRGPAMTSGSEPDASLAVNSSWSKKRKSSNDSGSRRKKFPSSFSEDQDSIQEPDSSVISIKMEAWDDLGLSNNGEKSPSNSFKKNPVEPCHVCGEIFVSRLALAKHFKSRHVRGNIKVRLDEGGEKLEQSANPKSHLGQKQQYDQDMESGSEVRIRFSC